MRQIYNFKVVEDVDGGVYVYETDSTEEDSILKRTVLRVMKSKIEDIEESEQRHENSEYEQKIQRLTANLTEKMSERESIRGDLRRLNDEIELISGDIDRMINSALNEEV